MITSRVKASTWTWRDPSNEIILPVTFYLWCAITQNGWTQNDVTGSCAHAPVYKRLRDQVSGVVAIWTPLVHRLPVTCTSCAPTSTKQSTVVKTEKKQGRLCDSRPKPERKKQKGSFFFAGNGREVLPGCSDTWRRISPFVFICFPAGYTAHQCSLVATERDRYMEKES